MAMKTDGLLVPVDFSPGSLRAIELALTTVDADGEVYLLHVIDADFIARVSEAGFSSAEAATARLREQAEERLRQLVQECRADSGPRLDSMVVIGKPFAEILRIASDLDFSLIVLSIHGRHRGDPEELLFGSTAEKVLRAARIPVLCVPDAVERDIKQMEENQ